MKKIIEWLIKIGLKLKFWFFKNWFVIANYIIIFVAYSTIYGKPDVLFAEVLLGLWLFTSAAYGMYKLVIKRK